MPANRSIGIIFGLWLAGVFCITLINKICAYGYVGVVAMVIAVGWPFIYFMITGGNFIPKLPSVDRIFAISIFFIISGLSMFVSIEPFVSVTYYIVTLLCFFICLQFNSSLTDENYMTGFRVYSIITVIILTVFSLFEYRQNTRLGEGLHILNPNQIAIICSSIIITAVSHKKLFVKLTIILITSTILILTGSRTSLIVTITGLFIIFWSSFKTILRKNKKLLILSLLSLVTFTVLYWDIILESILLFFAVDDKYRGVSTGVTGRMGLWKETWELFYNNPITGVGFRAHEPLIRGGTSSHNGYLALLAETGLIGFSSAMYIIFRGIWSLGSMVIKKNDSVCLNILLGLCVGYLFLAGFERYLFNVGNPTSILFMIGILIPDSLFGPSVIPIRCTKSNFPQECGQSE